VLAVVSAGILIIGAKLKPERAPEVPISQAEMVRLQTLTQRRNLEDLTTYFSGIADGVKSSLVWLEGMGTSGIVWGGDGLIVTAAPRKCTMRAVTAVTPAGEAPLQVDMLSADFPVASLKAPAESRFRPVFRAAAASLRPGTWILQVSSREDGGCLSTPGTYGGNVSAKCGDFDVETVKTSLPLTETSLGGGVFDMDGNLLGVVLRCGDHYAAVTPEGVDAVLAGASSFRGQLLRRYGLRAEALNEETRRYFKAETGVLVTEIRRGMPADVAGLVPGDVIQALDANPINTVDDLAPLVLPMAFPTFHVYVKRGRGTLRLNLRASDAGAPGAASEIAGQGIQLGSPPKGYLIENVIPGSRAERASLQAGDRLLQVGGREPGTLSAVRKLLSGSSQETLFVVVERGERKLGVFLGQ
jgi:serine protease Do